MLTAGHVTAEVPGLEPLQEFLRPPVGVLPPCCQQEMRHRLLNRVRTVMGRPTSVAQRRASARS